MAPSQPNICKRSGEDEHKAATPATDEQCHKVAETTRTAQSPECLRLCRQPLQTSRYCLLEVNALARDLVKRYVLDRRALSIAPWLVAVLASYIYAYSKVELFASTVNSMAYWTALGVASSIGFGFGLPTFMLYLVPFILRVRSAAFECGSLRFPKPPYPHDIICPTTVYVRAVPSIWSIIRKVQFESCCWGFGTALGELPPYFMARSSATTAIDTVHEELVEMKGLQCQSEQKDLLSSLTALLKLKVKQLVERAGFFGILLAASVPNPAFDIAGLMCGYYQVPFWKFFGATALGKAFFKTHLQVAFWILMASETIMLPFANFLSRQPIIGQKLELLFQSLMRTSMQSKKADGSAGIAALWNCFTTCLFVYFGITVVENLANNYRKRLQMLRKLDKVAAVTQLKQ